MSSASSPLPSFVSCSSDLAGVLAALDQAPQAAPVTQADAATEQLARRVMQVGASQGMVLSLAQAQGAVVAAQANADQAPPGRAMTPLQRTRGALSEPIRWAIVGLAASVMAGGICLSPSLRHLARQAPITTSGWVFQAGQQLGGMAEPVIMVP
jgi:hypothetical protein